MSATELEALLVELEAVTKTIPNTCGCCPPGGIANHDCNWTFRNHVLGCVIKVYRDPVFIKDAHVYACKSIREYIGYAKQHAAC